MCVCQLAFAILMSAVYPKQGISLNFSEKMFFSQTHTFQLNRKQG